MNANAPQNPDPVPAHVAIIMDGNGRWASARGLPRTAGHKAGVEAVKRTVEAAADLGIRHLTLFGFSSENWGRPAEEVGELMRLLRYYLRGETAELHKRNACLKVIGDRDRLAPDIVELIEQAESLTAGNTAITVTVALSYGGRADIVQAARAAARLAQAGEISPEQIDEQTFPELLQTAGQPDPDLLIRTSGEQRISNFLLWQCAYAEFWFTDTLWPDFGAQQLGDALAAYAGRDRRHGLVRGHV